MAFTYKHTRLACYCGYSVSAVINNFMPLLFVIFQQDFGITMGQLSFLITLNFGVQAVIDFLGAHLADKIGYKTTAVTANLVSAAGLIAVGVLPKLFSPYISLIISVITYATGSGLLEVIVSPIIEALPSETKSASMSLLHSFYCWGQVVTVLLTTAFFALFGTESWGIACIIWSVFPLFTALFFSVVPVLTFSGNEEKVPAMKLFSVKIFWIFLILMTCSGATELAMAQWASLFAETALGVSKTVGDIFGPCMFAVCMGIARVVYAVFAPKIKLANYIIFCSGLGVLSYLLVSLSPNSILALSGCALCGFSVGVMWPGTLSLAAEKCSYGGTALFALLALAGDIGCVSGPNTVTLFAEKFSLFGSPLKAGLLACVIFPGIMIICTLILKSTKDKRYE